jgi:hypothetical protein
MGFLDNIGNWASDTAKDFTSDIGWATAMQDLASVTTNDKNWSSDAFQLLGDTFKVAAAGVTYPLRKPLAAVFTKAILPSFEASYNTAAKFAREPISTAVTGLTTGNFQEAYNQRKEISAGQAMTYLQSRFDPQMGELRGDFNIFDPNDREIFDTNWQFRTVSGAYDTFFTTVTDPLGKLGKGIALARKGLVTRPMGPTDASAKSFAKDFFMPKSTRSVTMISPATFAAEINAARTVLGPLGKGQETLQSGLNNTLETFAQKDRLWLRGHPMVEASNDADTLSYLLAEAKTVDDVADTLLAVSVRDTEAMARLVTKRKDLAFVYDKLKPVSRLDTQVINGIPTNGIVQDIGVLDSADALVKLALDDPYIQYLTRLTEKGADLTKRTFGTPMAERGAARLAERRTARALGEQPSPTAYPTLGIFQPTKYHPMVAVVNFADRWAGDRPAGWFNANDSDSFNEIKAFGGILRRVVGANAEPLISQHFDLFIQAGDIPEARTRVAESFEQLAILEINRAKGISDATAEVIWGGYKGRRKAGMDSIRDRKFLMTDDNVILKVPYAERQGANGLPMVDLENYARVLEKNKGLIQAIEGSHGIADPDVNRYVMGLLNDVWKASVLLRLGYTVRNTAEATVSILAKGYGLVAAADINKESLSNWYQNRMIGFERLTDKNLVKKGVREDSVVVRNEMAATQLERAQIQKLNQDIDNHIESIELAFKRGKLTQEEALEFLTISSYRSGEILHHGSPASLAGLNPDRAFAMTYSEDIANRYAEAGMKIISAAKIQERLTGRAGRLPRNIERSPADEIGSPAIVERINDEAFTELNSYVNGDFSNAQKFLRDPGQFNYAPNNTPELPKGLQRTIQRSVLTKPLTVYRGTTNLKSPFVNAQIGDIIEEPAFISTSYSDDVARNFATPSTLKIGTSEPAEVGDYISTQIKMKLPKGLNGLDISQTYNQMKNLGYANLRRESMMMANRESEVLLPAGTKFRVVSRKQVDGATMVTVEAILPKRIPQVQAPKGLQTIASDMRDGFRNSIAKGNRVELLNPQTGSWRAVDPDTVSQKLLVEGQFRIVKPGNQGQVVTSKVYGTSVDLRAFTGSRVRLGLNDYPELKKLGIDARKPDSWKGKEKELLEWMRDNKVGKLTLPDSKANGRATVLVDPKMVETAGQNPAADLARTRIETIRNTENLLKNESRIMDMLRVTIQNEGGTFGLQTGAVPQTGYSVAVRGATWQYQLDDVIADTNAARESLIQHMEDTLDKFEGADHFGTWVAPNDNGVMTVWAEPVNVIKDRAKAVKVGKSRNQQAIADLDRITQGDFDNAFIKTGGTGDEGASAEFALGKISKANKGNDTAGAQSVRGGFSRPSYSQSTGELADLIADGRYPAEGMINLVRELADRGSLAKAKHENLMLRLNARVVQETRLNAPKARIGTGTYRQKLYDGTEIEHPDAGAGELGDILMQRTDNADTYKLMADAPSRLFAARYGGMEELRLSSNDPRYFNGYANYLNNLWRSPNENKIDPIIQKFLDNQTPEDVVRWLRKTDEGKAYSSKMNIDDRAFKVPSENLNVGTDAEDFVGNLYSSYSRYLPDAEIQEAFRNNLIDEMYLRTHFADQPAMPDIIGSVIPQAPGVSGLPGAAQSFVQKAFYFLGSLPETTLARHPLARAVYRGEMRQRGDIALSLKRSQTGDPKAELTLDEINNFRKDAVESTRKEVNKTLFTIMRKSYAGEKMRYLMPFFNAWENTVRRWATLSKDNPAAIARAGQIVSSLSNQNNYVDKDGNPSSVFNYDSKIILPMPETFMKTMEKVPGGKGLAEAIRSAGSQVSIPMRSLDVMFQGELTAGFGPVVAIPAQYLEIMRPDMEGILSQVIPFGASDAPFKTLLPPALQKAAQLWSATRDGSWSRTFNTVYRYELIKYRLGERETEPTFKEINDLTNNMYKVKALSNLVLPFAAQYDSPLGWYTQQYRKLQQTYGSQADILFLQMYPEMGEATISASLNNTGVDATQAAVSNLKKYDDLIAKIGTTTPEMIGFLVNDPDGKYDFSQAAYQWQMRNSPTPGSTSNFRGQRDPALLKQDAQKKMGWIDYRKGMDYLDQQLFAQGYTSYSERGAEELNLAKQAYTQQLVQTNKDWAADFYSVDKGKWIYRMQTIETILRDPQWMRDNGNKPVVGAIATYYITRSQIARELASRKSGGASGTLTAADNADLEGLWNQTIATLKQESLEFSSFYNRFLQNDPVTLG